MKSFIQIPVNGCTPSFELSDTPSVCGILLFMKPPRISYTEKRSLRNFKGEEWRPVIGYENSYLVSNLGRIKSKRRNHTYAHSQIWPEKIIKAHKSQYGYFYFNRWRENKCKAGYVHKIVAEAFLENPENKPVVNHINGCKYDNRLLNLEWATKREDVAHAIRTGLMKSSMRGRIRGKSPSATPVLQYSLSGEFIREWECIADAAEAIGANHGSSISICCRGITKTSGGFIWKYKIHNAEAKEATK